MLSRTIRSISLRSRAPWRYVPLHLSLDATCSRVILKPSQRGMHNIENELIFRSNDKFVFHDSEGFEAGHEDEFVKAKKFIADRANTTFLKKRIHAIW